MAPLVMIAARLAAAGLVLAGGGILLHAQGFGYDEVRRPAVVLGAALVLAAGAGAGHAATGRLRMSDLALLAVAVSGLVAVNRTESAAALFPAAAAWIFLRGGSLGWIPRPFLERRGLPILSVVGILFSGYGVCQALGADVLGWGRGTLAVSTLGNTNYAGVLSAALALTGLAEAVFDSRFRWRLVGAAAAVLGALHVAASGSLGGLLGLGAGVAAFAAMLVRRHGFRSWTVAPLLVLGLALAPVAPRVWTRVADIARGEDRTARVRLGLWKGTVRLAADHPVLGCGAGNFRMAFPPYRDADERRLSHEGKGISYVEAEDPHNSYLALLAESGPVALIAVLAVLVLSVAAGIRRARVPDPEAAGLAFAGTAGLVALAVSAGFNSLGGHLPFAFLAGIFAAITAPVVSASPAAPGVGVRVVRIAAAVLLAVATIPWLVADVRYRDAMHTSNPAERIGHAQAALNSLPGHWQARFQVALSWRALQENEGSARAELREVLRIHPHHVAALLELASGLPSAAEEEELLRRAENLAPEFVLVQARLAGLDMRRRDYASIRRRMERILEALPEEPETLYTIARTWLWERRPEEALPWLRRAAAKNPKLRERLGDDHPELKGDPRFAGLMGP